MADIFISYAREDVDTARRLAEALAGQGWSVWWDRQLSAGQHFERLIEIQLKAARCVVVLWSAAAVESEWVQDEAAYARDRQRLVPAWLEPVDLPFRFARLHTMDLVGWHGDASHSGFRRLVEDISGLLSAPARPGEAERRQAEQEATKAEEEQRRRNEAEARSKTEKERQRAEALRAPEQAREEETKREVEEARKHREQQEAEEARKRAETEARQAAEEQQREAQRQREQDEARHAAEAEAARAKPTKGPRTSLSVLIFHQKRWMALIGAVAVAAVTGVVVWQELGKENPSTPLPSPATQESSGTSVVQPPIKPDQPEVTTRPTATPTKDQPGRIFRDCDGCPEMVVIPAGSFTMGSPADEPERDSDEGPPRQVTIAPFAIGKTEVTFAQWDACVATDGCNGYKPPDEGWGRGSRPVINVSWKDAQAYASWLSQYTGKRYRLPSEAEWEYAARAGGMTMRYAFGDRITPKDANYGDEVSKTTEVSAYPPNAWGLYDMHGNVWEWVEDVWHESYHGAPIDGAAWTDSEEEDSSRNRVRRGGGWLNNPRYLRSAYRNWSDPDDRLNGVGFRVARTLD